MKIEELQEEFKGLEKLIKLLMKNINSYAVKNEKFSKDLSKMKSDMVGNLSKNENECMLHCKQMDDRLKSAVKVFQDLENKLLDMIHRDKVDSDLKFSYFGTPLLRIAKVLSKMNSQKSLEKELKEISLQIENLGM